MRFRSFLYYLLHEFGVLMIDLLLVVSLSVSAKLNYLKLQLIVIQETSGKWHLYCNPYNNSNRVLMQQCPDYEGMI